MRKQLCEIRDIEQYLEQQQDTADQRVFEACELTSPELAAKVSYQRKIIQLVRWLARRNRRQQLDDLYQQLMTDETYRQKITSIFQ
ncbi:hypothetical protein SAMN04488128_1021220 [Chitinophaga eiseniae]|uniref:Uncharacterized protein n=1 Tax=Chitinophaga eiseniae TaxID=634771 RepID=A0A1T4RJI0_9BACT|nr:hypothetical protein [Chitinophaga eiseniae]SKA16123.1 hypothetical protein SAMN04488128_1021220 [Chitinophaga eiseniae]